jgi:hypothetical protein
MIIETQGYKQEFTYCVDIRNDFPNCDYGFIWIKDKWNDIPNKKCFQRIYSVMGWHQKWKRGTDQLKDTIMDAIDKFIPIPTTKHN